MRIILIWTHTYANANKNHSHLEGSKNPPKRALRFLDSGATGQALRVLRWRWRRASPYSGAFSFAAPR
jgi:hypothetical protein